MKTTITTFICALVSATAFAQGKVNFENDAASPVTLFGSPVTSGLWAAGLYAGTSSSSLSLVSATTVSTTLGNEGRFGPMNVTLPSPDFPPIASGTPITSSTPWFQARVWDGAYPSFEAALAAGRAAAQGQLFQMNPGILVYVPTAPPSINSTWKEGNIELSPEPSTLSLAALGAGLMLYRGPARRGNRGKRAK